MHGKTISKDLRSLANPAKAKVYMRFFKTGKGQYGEGDVFYGLTVPQTRAIANKHSKKASLQDISFLLNSKVHEERLAALLILVWKFQHSNERERKTIFDFYLKNAKRVNNWDLVDLSADKIVGAFLEGKGKSVLKKLAKSDNVWERRIAMISSFHFIKKGSCEDAYEIAELLMKDKHDLIHKATGWMLREAGKKCSEKSLLAFLDKNAKKMPRTMLRYSIERLSEKKRRYYLHL